MLPLKNLTLLVSKQQLREIPDGKVLINTINAHSFNMAQRDCRFAAALLHGDYLIPDGTAIVKACKWLRCKSRPQERIAGWDLFEFEMQKLEAAGGRCMFMGSSPHVLELIVRRAAAEYPHIDIVTYSPPYTEDFSEVENQAIVSAINECAPDLLWIGMTAPKQEKWIYAHWNELEINCHTGTIGAVFDFYAGTVARAPKWWQDHSLEWLYRLMKDPQRLWRRYILGNPLFMWNIFKEGFTSLLHK